MARIIEFYVPSGFQKKETPEPDLQKGKIIEFCVAYEFCIAYTKSAYDARPVITSIEMPISRQQPANSTFK